MELGEKLRSARLEAGLTQRQLCGDEITRNMLSQIENGIAKPSMKTLQYLASRLGKNVSYFLEEDAVVSPNLQVMTQARQQFDAADYRTASDTLARYRGPDPVYDREKQLLLALTGLALAQQALEEGRPIYARELLNQTDLTGVYCEEALRRRWLLLLGKTGNTEAARLLPGLDDELILRAKEAFRCKNLDRAGQLLDAAEDRTAPLWNLLRGQIHLARTQYKEAAACLLLAEDTYPEETRFRLEHCYRELEDYKRAYEYARKQK